MITHSRIADEDGSVLSVTWYRRGDEVVFLMDSDVAHAMLRGDDGVTWYACHHLVFDAQPREDDGMLTCAAGSRADQLKEVCLNCNLARWQFDLDPPSGVIH